VLYGVVLKLEPVKKFVAVNKGLATKFPAASALDPIIFLPTVSIVFPKVS